MREWVEKNQVYLNKLIEKREKYGVLDSLSK
jgi:hypothetical protein